MEAQFRQSVSSTIHNGLNDTAKRFFTTGDPIVDSLILAHLIPYAVRYVTNIVQWSITTIIMIVKFLWAVTYNYFQSKMMGEVLCKVYLYGTENRELNEFIQRCVFDPEVESTADIGMFRNMVIDDNIAAGVEVIDGKDTNGGLRTRGGVSRYFTHKHVDKTAKARMDYADGTVSFMPKHSIIDDDDKKEKDVSDTYIGGREEVKLFEYKNCIIVFKLFGYSKMPTIHITVISLKQRFDESKVDDYAKMIEEFLQEKFNMNGELVYTYEIDIGGNMAKKLVYLMARKYDDDKCHYINRDTGLLVYGDETSLEEALARVDVSKKKQVMKLRTNKIKMQCGCGNIGDENTDYREYFEYSCNTEGSYRSAARRRTYNVGHFGYYVTKYFGDWIHGVNWFGHFKKDNVIYLVSDVEDSKLFKVQLVVFGKHLTQTDITDKLHYLLKIALTNINAGEKRHLEEKLRREQARKERGDTDDWDDDDDDDDNKMKRNAVKIYKRSNVDGDEVWKLYAAPSRSLNTVYLPEEIMKEMRGEIERFMRMEKAYREFEIPYRKGILLYGPPGTGKTSLVKAIATEYRLDIYLIDVNDASINDETISDVLASIGGGNKILLFEDVDSAFADKEVLKESERVTAKEVVPDPNPGLAHLAGHPYVPAAPAMTQQVTDKKFLTYSGLLNALDGVLSNHHGVITFMTTNYKHKLGSALIRPGRIDRQFELKECTTAQAQEMVTEFLRRLRKLVGRDDPRMKNVTKKIVTGKAEKLAKDITVSGFMTSIKPCELQQYLIRHLEEPDLIFENWDELVKTKKDEHSTAD